MFDNKKILDEMAQYEAEGAEAQKAGLPCEPPPHCTGIAMLAWMEGWQASTNEAIRERMKAFEKRTLEENDEE